MDKLRSSVRPMVTFWFVLAQIALALAWANGMEKAEQAFAALSAFTMMIVRDYFNSREKAQETQTTAGQK